jgi:hypothetical protein
VAGCPTGKRKKKERARTNSTIIWTKPTGPTSSLGSAKRPSMKLMVHDKHWLAVGATTTVRGQGLPASQQHADNEP